MQDCSDSYLAYSYLRIQYGQKQFRAIQSHPPTLICIQGQARVGVMRNYCRTLMGQLSYTCGSYDFYNAIKPYLAGGLSSQGALCLTEFKVIKFLLASICLLVNAGLALKCNPVNLVLPMLEAPLLTLCTLGPRATMFAACNCLANTIATNEASYAYIE
jgi:hypothetical protein